MYITFDVIFFIVQYCWPTKNGHEECEETCNMMYAIESGFCDFRHIFSRRCVCYSKFLKAQLELSEELRQIDEEYTPSPPPKIEMSNEYPD